jgi:hypothetical protein
VTPQLELQVAFFNNLKPMPLEVTHQLTNSGSLGEGKELHGEQNVLREVNATVVINREVARLTIELLQRMLSEIDGHIKADTERRERGESVEKNGQSSEVK